jgi:hypothetical protein
MVLIDGDFVARSRHLRKNATSFAGDGNLGGRGVLRRATSGGEN